jgi:aminomuconate-semialdehyde/2-hydroxymuconate-6-semialdehyde dehydrogenase
MQRIRNYIDGELIEPLGGGFLENYEPGKGLVYSEIPDSKAEDVERAYQAARDAFPDWSRTDKETRSKLLLRVAERIEERIDELAEAESRDNGKPVWLAKQVDIPRAASNFRFFATGLMHFASEAHDMEGKAINYTLREPLGVVGCISPWNLPLYLFTWKIAPALAAGNCLVAKPSEVTPMTAYLLSEICQELGLPAGVLNIVHGLGSEVGDAITEHKGIKAIAFTGGTATGAEIARKAAPQFKKLSLELGGKNPNIIFDDCDFDRMLKTTLKSSFANQGEICLCGSRIFIHKNIYERFKEAFVEKAKKMKVSSPDDPEAGLGAIVSKEHKEKILSYISLAKEEGGRILCGGEEVKLEGEYADGWYIRPTVIEGLSYDCRTNQEEIFGPVVTLIPFESEDEVLRYANSVPYGLSATIWTKDLDRAHRVAQRIEAGIVWINCWLVRDLRTPFGGMKQSGVGREGGWEAFRFFTEPKNVCVRIDSGPDG